MHKIGVDTKGEKMVVSLVRSRDVFDEEFAYDPLWDDDDDWITIPREEEDEEEVKTELFHSMPENVPDSDEDIMDQSKLWVNTMMSSLALCPFTQGSEMAGLPMGKIRYNVDRVKDIEGVYEKYWEEVMLMDESDEKVREGWSEATTAHLRTLFDSLRPSYI